MEVHFTPEMEARLTEAATADGLPADEWIQDVVGSYVIEAMNLRNTLDSRYDDIKSGKVKAIDGEAFFESLRQRDEERFCQNPQQ